MYARFDEIDDKRIGLIRPIKLYPSFEDIYQILQYSKNLRGIARS
jgi:hypothetical protein